MRGSFSEAKRVVLKTGSALIVDKANGQMRRAWLASMAEDIAACRARGQEIVIVTSGAIPLGRERLGLGFSKVTRPLRLEEKQAAAAVGQMRLVQAWQEALAPHDLVAAQILLTLDDTEDRQRHLNARATMQQVLELGAIPVINENDTIATSEIRFGDNDRLAARVAQMVSADALVLLSDIDGLYTADPRTDSNAQLIQLVQELTPDIEAMAGKPQPGYSSGGMVTKIQAARIAMAAGCRMAIARGQPMHALAALDQSETPCTWFVPQAEPRTARKKWIAGHVRLAGILTLDDGAVKALRAGRSLLAAGIKDVAGDFQRGDAVRLCALDGHEVARGLSAYGSDDLRRVIGRKSEEFLAVLGFTRGDEVVHRDDMVVA